MVKEAYNICTDCDLVALESAAYTKTVLKAKNNETCSRYETLGAQILEQIQKGFFRITQAPVTPSQNFTSYGFRHHPSFLGLFSTLADFNFHSDIHRKSESKVR